MKKKMKKKVLAGLCLGVVVVFGVTACKRTTLNDSVTETTSLMESVISEEQEKSDSSVDDEFSAGGYVYSDNVEVKKIDSMIYCSPNGKLSVNFYTDRDGAYYYSVSANETELLKIAALGLKLENYDFDKGFLVDESGIVTTEINEKFDLFTGANSEHINHCKETVIPFKNDAGSFELVLRVYNEGMAIKYRNVTVSKEAVEKVTVIKELTQFGLVKSATTWAFGINGTYEGEYVKRNLFDLQTTRAILSAPVYVYAEGYYMLLTEASVFNNNGEYCSSGLRTGKFLTWTPGLARDPKHDATGDLDSPGHIEIKNFETVNGFSTPWRVAIMTDDLNTFMTTDMIAALNPEPDAELFSDTSWINPGVVAWSWWAEGDTQGNYDKQAEYVDFAAENGWEYVCLDAGWRAFENRIDTLCAYAKEKNVGIYVWVNYRDINDVTKCEKLFSKWSDAGIVGIKTDYFESDAPEMMRCMQDVAQIAAKYQLMVLYHGCIRPGGEQRTYPNVLTMEAVMGEEFHKWSTAPTVKNCLVYPFTRNLVGPMDYTPCCQATTNDETAAFALAKSVVYESGLNHFSDAAGNYKKFAALPFLNRIDASWDETKIIDGEPGEHISMVRRNGEDYFIGGMTLNSRKVEYSLSFLPEGIYNAYIYTDNSDGSGILVSAEQVTNNSVLSYELLERGGIAILFTKDEIDVLVAQEESLKRDSYTFYEAESDKNILEGDAVAASAALCSGRKKVGYLGKGATLTITGVSVPQSGEYEVILYCCTGERRKLSVSVNGETAQEFWIDSTGGYGVAGETVVYLNLHEGENSITFGNDDGFAPDIDVIAVKKNTL